MTRSRAARIGLVMLLPMLSLAAMRVAGPFDAPPALSVPEYIAQLDALASTIGEEGHAPSARMTALVNTVPREWLVAGPQRTFRIETAWLRDAMGEWRVRRDASSRAGLINRLRTLRSEAARFLEPNPALSSERDRLNGILSQKEFQNIHGPTWMDRLRQRVFELLARALRGLFGSSVIPTVGNTLAYVLIGIALIVVAVWTYRLIRRDASVETILAEQLTPSTKEWSIWLSEAQAAAERGLWRDAVHNAYWCAVSFLEAKGAWRPDRALTPREYVRLLPSSSDDRSTLDALTHRFEVVWYGAGESDAHAFADALASLKKMGCPSA